MRLQRAGGSAFGAVALRASVNSSNVTELALQPLEAEDVCRINGRSVATQRLLMHRDGTVVEKRPSPKSPTTKTSDSALAGAHGGGQVESLRRYPTPGSVISNFGLAGSASSLRRSWAMYTRR